MDAGTIIFIVVLVIVMPVGILMSMAGLAGVIGSLIGRNSALDNVTDDGAPNEYLQLSDANPYAGPESASSTSLRRPRRRLRSSNPDQRRGTTTWQCPGVSASVPRSPTAGASRCPTAKYTSTSS